METFSNPQQVLYLFSIPKGTSWDASLETFLMHPELILDECMLGHQYKMRPNGSELKRFPNVPC